MTDPHSNPRVQGDELCSRRLGEEASASQEASGGDARDERAVDPAVAQRAADVQLVHSLLIHLHDDADTKEARIARVLEGLQSEIGADAAELAHRRRWRFPIRRSGIRWAAAASLALVVALWAVFLSTGTATAVAQLDRVLAATNQQVDRTYEITAEFDEDFIREHFGDRLPPLDPLGPPGEGRGPGPEGRPFRKGPPPGEEPFLKGRPKDRGDRLGPPDGRIPPDDRKGPPRGPDGDRLDEGPRGRIRFHDGPGWMHPDDHRPPPHPDGPPRGFRGPPPLPLNGATLFVRGGDQFVLRRPLPDGRSFVIGSNGRQTWFVPPQGPVRVSDNPKDFRGPLPEFDVTIPFINIKSDIEPLRAHYDLTMLEPAGLSKDDPVMWSRLEGRRRADAPPGPKLVRIWADPNTGVVRRLECENMPMPRHPDDPRPPKGPTLKVTVDLVDQSPLDEGWFDHDAHHDAGREVSRLAPDERPR